MNARRRFLKLASVAAIPASSMILGQSARAEDGREKELVGAWRTVHTLPFPPGFFREFLTLCEGGTLMETNSFLHTNSNVDFSVYGLPNVVNASDGQGNWERIGNGRIQATFRKMLFDGARENFGDLRVVGTLQRNGARLVADWQIEVVDAQDNLLANLGTATSEGYRIG